VNALATVPSQNRVFSAGSDGQVGSIAETAVRWINCTCENFCLSQFVFCLRTLEML
jgi:hypothetical protein